MSFAVPWALLALPLPLLIWWGAPPHRTRAQALRFPFFQRIVAATGQQARSGSTVLRRGWVQMGAAWVIWLCLVIAMAQPERLGALVEQTVSARDLIVAIDISGSMDTRDMQNADGAPEQRLAVVREVVGSFIDGRADDRIGLIVFGSRAYIQAPLTEDTATISDLLDQTEVGMAGPHTALGDAIGLAIRSFENSEVEDRLLVLLSDGGDTASRMSPVSAAAIAAEQGVQIITVGVGDPEATGEAKVDLPVLKDIASRTGGAFFFADDGAALEQIYDEIDRLAPREVETLSHRPRIALAHLFLAVALGVGLAALSWMCFAKWRAGRTA